jgi:3-dehydroquinate dehydratase-1
MLRLGTLPLGSIPRIVAPLSERELRGPTEDVRRYADVAELRIDRFERHDRAHVEALCRTARALDRPVIATIRAANEGGAVALDDAQRTALFQAVWSLVDAVDIELRARICRSVIDDAHRHGKTAIVSHHDFAATPSDAELAALCDAAADSGADIVKITAHAASAADTDRLLGLLRARRDRGLIVIAMGTHGVASRVFFPLFGSLLTYGFVAQSGAPGQLPLAELYRELQRYSPAFAAAHPA